MKRYTGANMVAACMVLATIMIFVVGCSGWNDDRGVGDAPIKDPKDDSPAYIINFPDRFANVAFKCFGTTGVYTTTRNAPPILILDDPKCSVDEG